MNGISLEDRLNEYAKANNSIKPPSNKEEEQLFNSVVNKNSITYLAPLDLDKVRKQLYIEKAEEVELNIGVYKEVAKELGVNFIDTGFSLNSAKLTETKELGVEIMPNPVDENKEVYQLTHCYLKRKVSGKRIKANALLFPDGSMQVLTGSDIVEEERDNDYVKSIRNQIRSKYRNGVITEDILCDSPSNAATLVIGYNANGWNEWKDINGDTINKYRGKIQELTGLTLEPDTEDIQVEGIDEEEVVPIDVNSEVEEVETPMAIETEMMPIPKVSLANTSLKELKSILNEPTNKLIEATDRLVEAVKAIKGSSDNTYFIQSMQFKIEDKDVAYTEEDRDNEVIGIPFSKVKTAVNLGMNIIYRGVPGCGKTFAANCDAKALLGIVKTNRIKQIDFTENLDYSDTMIGLRQLDDGKWHYVKGEIAQFCAFASQNLKEKFILILNEFTRANTEAVLGQMFTAMERKYRGTEFTLANGDTFVCPKNLIILATMNGTDKGVKKLDKATEERFYIIDIKPLWEIWAKDNCDTDEFNELIDSLEIPVDSLECAILKDLCKNMASFNTELETNESLSTDKQIGQRQLLQFKNQKDLNDKPIKYTKEVLGIVIEQMLNRIKPTVELYSSNPKLKGILSSLKDLLELCHV